MEVQPPRVTFRKPVTKFPGGFHRVQTQKKSPVRSTSEQPKDSVLKQEEIMELMSILTQQKMTTSVDDIKNLVSGFSATKAQQFIASKNDKSQIKKLIDEIYSK